MDRRSPADDFFNLQKLVILAGYLLVAGMLACAAAAYTRFCQALLPGWEGDYLPWFSLAVVLESLYSRRRVRALELDALSRAWLVYRFSEWAAIAVSLRLALYLAHGFGGLAADLAAWQANPLAFFSGEYGAALAAVVVLTSLAAGFAGDLDELDLSDAEIEAEREFDLKDQQPQIRGRVAGRALAVGALLILAVTLTRLGLGQFLLGETPAASLPVAALLAYFALALLLVSLIQLAALRKRWVFQEFKIGPQIARNWLGYSLAFFGLVGVAAWLLPSRYAMGFLQTLSYALYLLVQAANLLNYLFFALLSLFFLPLNWLMRLLGLLDPASPPAPPAPILPPAALEPVPAAPAAWLEALRSLLFWVVFLGMTAGALIFILRQNTRLWQGLQRIPLILWLGQNLSRLWQGLRRLNRRLAQAAAAGWQRLAPPKLGPPRPLPEIDFRRLDARRQVIHWYLALVQRAGAAGYPRPPAQTPHRYRETLAPLLGEAPDDLETLTESFVEARYSPGEVTPTRAGLVRQAWERAAETIRRKSQP